MRKEKEVKERLSALCVDRLKKRKDEFLSVDSRNCEFNARARISGKGMVGFCKHKGVRKRSSDGVVVCDGKERAKKCGSFKCKNTHKSVEEDFHIALRSPARCGNEYPKIAILIWFLQDFPKQSRLKRMTKSSRELSGSLYRLLFFRWW
jgi:hypothetical protein